MAKQQQQQRDRERAAKVGKGKVTLVQVAFIVERYLADNNYTNALTAFRSDAADLFAKMKQKKNNSKVPSGLLGLGEILDEYITLKEQKLLLQSNQMRVHKAMQDFHSLFQSYYSSSATLTSAASPSSPTNLVPPLFVSPNPLIMPPTTSPPGLPTAPTTTTPGSLMNTSQAMAVTTPSTSNTITNFSTPITNSLYLNASHNKRKTSRPVPNTLPAFKKPCTAPSSVPSTGKIVSATSNMQEKMQLVKNSIAKSLFKPGHPISNASPETPQPNKLIAPLEKPSSCKPNSTCSIVSSERIIVSPLKGGAAYYSIERSCQFTSPLKLDGRKSSKRDHVKGRLNFDSADVNEGPSPSEAAIVPNSEKVSSSPSTYSLSSSDGGENNSQVGDVLDFDFSDFDILNGDFSFSELLVDLDLDCEVQSSPEQTNSTPRLNSEVVDGEMAHTICLDSSKLPVLRSPDASVQGGHESVASFRAITKRVKIVSPVKAMRKL